MRADAFEQNGVLFFIFYELENNPKVVARTARPGSGELAFQLVSFELRMKRVLGKEFQRQFATPVRFEDACE